MRYMSHTCVCLDAFLCATYSYSAALLLYRCDMTYSNVPDHRVCVYVLCVYVCVCVCVCVRLQIACAFNTHVTLQHPATHSIVLQHTATHCNTVWHGCVTHVTYGNTADHIRECVMSHCNTPQHTATHCNTLQHTTT